MVSQYIFKSYYLYFNFIYVYNIIIYIFKSYYLYFNFIYVYYYILILFIYILDQ